MILEKYELEYGHQAEYMNSQKIGEGVRGVER
jgi:hypothetical protein